MNTQDTWKIKTELIRLSNMGKQKEMIEYAVQHLNCDDEQFVDMFINSLELTKENVILNYDSLKLIPEKIKLIEFNSIRTSVRAAKLEILLEDIANERRMLMKQNPLTGDWLCYIPNCPFQAYYYDNKRLAEKFVNNVNNAISSGELYFDKTGTLKRKI